MIKHFVWRLNGESGRVAIALNHGEVRIAQISGKAPPAAMSAWWNVLNAHYTIDGVSATFAARAIAASWPEQPRRLGVVQRRGMSGSIDFLLVMEQSVEMRDYPTLAKLHISMYGRLNSGLRMHIAHLLLLTDHWESACADSPMAEYTYLGDEDLVIEEVPTRDPAKIVWLEMPQTTEQILKGGSLLKELYGDEA